MEYEVAVASFASGYAEVEPLIRQHYEEVGTDIGPLDINTGIYFAAERNGRLLYLTYRKDGVLAGYLLAFLVESRVAKATLTLIVEGLYIRPEHRGRRGGIRLMERALTIGSQRGAKVSVAAAKPGHKAAARLFEHMGFVPDEVVYLKRE